MGAVGAVGWLVSLAAFGRETGAETLAGMAGPLLVGSASVVLTERTYRLAPDRVMPLMMMAFVVKMVVFGAYVAIMLSLASLQPVPFAASFITFFIVLHLVEAGRLRALFAGNIQPRRPYQG